jgi:hypothetical protein
MDEDDDGGNINGTRAGFGAGVGVDEAAGMELDGMHRST